MAHHPHSNTSGDTAAYFDQNADMDWFLPRIPEPFRRWLQYECDENMSSQMLWEAFKAGEPWWLIWENVYEQSKRTHADMFGDRTLWRPKPVAEIQSLKEASRSKGVPTLDEFWRLR